MKKKILIAAGFSFLVLTAVWQLALVPRLTGRIPTGWTWKAEFIGSNNYPDPETGKLLEKATTSIYRRQMFVESEADRPRSIIVADTYFTLDPATGKKVWETARPDVTQSFGTPILWKNGGADEIVLVALRRFEAADLALVGAGERTALVAEQL